MVVLISECCPKVCVEGRDTVPAVFLSPSSVPASPQRRKRRASPAGPFRSRMRRTTNHYTPQPILPPDREGSGLLIETTAGKLLYLNNLTTFVT